VRRSQAFHDAPVHATALRPVIPASCRRQGRLGMAHGGDMQATRSRLYSGAHAPASPYAMIPMPASARRVIRALPTALAGLHSAAVTALVLERRLPCWTA
jgi:hypothetical protein